MTMPTPTFTPQIVVDLICKYADQAKPEADNRTIFDPVTVNPAFGYLPMTASDRSPS